MREPKIFSRKRRHGITFYVEIDGQQINLGTDEAEANKEYHRLMHIRQSPSARMPVVVLIDRFLSDLEDKARARRTFIWYKRHLDSFTDWIKGTKYPDLPIGEFTAEHVDAWLEARYDHCGDNTRLGAIRAISRVCNREIKKSGGKTLAYNPVKGVERPTYQPRECYVEPADWEKFFSETKGPFRDIIHFLRLTGCRPDEACRAEVRHFERDRCCLVFAKEESKGKKKRRVIPLVGEAFEIVQRLALVAGDGPIFRTQRGAAWTNSSLNSCCDNVEYRSEVKLSPYALRHTFITDKLTAGMNPVTLAKIVGHTDLKMINDIYAHLDLKMDYLREALERTNNVA